MGAATARRLWLKLHRWVGLSLGSLLLLSGLTGVLLMLGEPLDEAVHSHLYRATPNSPDAADSLGTQRLDTALQALRQEFGPEASFTLRPPRAESETLHAFVDGPWDGTVFFDPTTARELGRMAQDEGAFNLLFGLHSTLLASDTGRAVLALAVLGYVVLLATGAVLWWPRQWAQAFRVQWHAGSARTLFDLHRVGGATLGLLVLVSVLSGAYMAWRPISVAVSAVSASPPVVPPRLAQMPVQAVALADAAVETARLEVPDAMVGYVQVPAYGLHPIRIRLRTADDPHPNGLSSVYVHPDTQQVLAVHRWDALDIGTSAYSWIYPLHIGELGGWATWVLTLLSGLALSGLGMSGVWLWWRRRRRA